MFEGATQFGKLVPGGKFKLQSKPASRIRRHLRRAQRRPITPVTTAGSTRLAPRSYSNRFTCFPSKVTWRQPTGYAAPAHGRHPHRHRAGPAARQGARSTAGRRGNHTDDWPVKVRFYWDHRDEATGRRSRSGRASSSPGPARAGARSSFRASAPRSRWPSSMAIPIGRSSSAASTTAATRRSTARPTRPSPASARGPA